MYAEMEKESVREKIEKFEKNFTVQLKGLRKTRTKESQDNRYKHRDLIRRVHW